MFESILRIARSTRLAAWWLLACTLGSSAAAQPAQSRALDYVAPPRIGSLSMNPSNTHAAFIYTTESGSRVLAVMDLAKPGEVKPIAGSDTADIVRVRWVNDQRLVFDTEVPDLLINNALNGMFAVDRDGGRQEQLVSWQQVGGPAPTGSRFKARLLPFGWFYFQSLHNQGDEILVVQVEVDSPTSRRVRTVARLDTVTGRLTDIARGLPDGTSSILTDGAGEVIGAYAVQAERERLFHRPAGGREWLLLEDNPLLADESIEPVYAEADGTWVVSTRRGRDTRMLASYDPRTRKLSPDPLIAVDGFDVSNFVELDNRQRLVVGAYVQVGRWQSVWFDEGLAKTQQEIDAALPQRSNFLECQNCPGAQRIVIRSISDGAPPEYWIYDRSARRLGKFASSRPWLDGAAPARRSYHRVPARDGLPLPVFVTHPPGAADSEPRPVVMLVHGGPWVRGSGLGWEQESAFLASRGFRVVEVEFRGSLGFGFKHFRAGWRQWGQAMQDDLADVLDWAEKNKLTEPGRACIVGGSYGGYAAMMGPVRHPKAWACAASLNGVSDLQLLFKWRFTDVSEGARRFSMPTLLGDPVADAGMLKQHSPLHRAADIKVPLFLAYGSGDTRVDPVHSQRIADAAMAAGTPVTLVRYQNEGHSLYLTSNRADYLERLAEFLTRHIPPAKK